MTLIFYGIIGVALAVMLAAMALTMRLRRLASGGRVGSVVNVMLAFVLFFSVGYLAALFLPRLPEGAALLLVGFVFLFGAIFVVIVLRLIESLMRQIFEDLRL